MDKKEFLEKYVSKKALDDAEKNSQENLRRKKIAELDKGIQRAKEYLKKDDPNLYYTALAELENVKSEIDFYHRIGTRLKQEDFNHYDTKVKREIKNLIAIADHRSKSSKVNPYQQKIYKSVEDEAKGYLKNVSLPKSETGSVKPILEKLEKVFRQERFQKDMQSLRKKFGSEKSNEAVNAYKTLALSIKDPAYKVVCLREAKEKYAPNKDMEKVLQRNIDNIISYVKKHKEKYQIK